MLQVNNIVTAYGAIEALRGVNLEANNGEITCLLGPNGAGKTTLMMTIAGILRPREGTIKFNGENIENSAPSDIVAKGIALVPENRLVFPDMNVRDNLIAGAYCRLSKAKARPQTQQLATVRLTRSSSPVLAPDGVAALTLRMDPAPSRLA